MSEQEYAALVELAAKHLTLVDCPAQETVQLQVQEFSCTVSILVMMSKSTSRYHSSLRSCKQMKEKSNAPKNALFGYCMQELWKFKVLLLDGPNLILEQ